ncbi:hypothetical protein [Rothia nasimurium]|uniref:hypothetical protein n=1 Tax=Rothia nasimurium TaxID=85336 RepID=UPI001F445392|nr:hypothetical protein [Rothia nasimurium]
MKTHSLALTLTAVTLTFTACAGAEKSAVPNEISTSSSSPSSSPSLVETSQSPSKYTWEAGPYPTDAPSLLTKEDPADRTGWYMGAGNSSRLVSVGDEDFSQWQTIYSYKDAKDPRGATIAVVFYLDDPDTFESRCELETGISSGQVENHYASWINGSVLEESAINSRIEFPPLYGYVTPGEGRTYPKAVDKTVDAAGKSIPLDVLQGGDALRNMPAGQDSFVKDNPDIEDAGLYSENTSFRYQVQAADAVALPGLTATFYANYTKKTDSPYGAAGANDFVATGCATVYTALSNEAAEVYDQTKFKQAYEQAIEFAQEIQTMPTKKSL